MNPSPVLSSGQFPTVVSASSLQACSSSGTFSRGCRMGKTRTAIISTTASAQSNRREEEYIGALLPIAGATVLTHLVRSLVNVGFNHLVVVHGDSSQDIADEME